MQFGAGASCSLNIAVVYHLKPAEYYHHGKRNKFPCKSERKTCEVKQLQWIIKVYNPGLTQEQIQYSMGSKEAVHHLGDNNKGYKNRDPVQLDKCP